MVGAFFFGLTPTDISSILRTSRSHGLLPVGESPRFYCYRYNVVSAKAVSLSLANRKINGPWIRVRNDR